MECNSQLNSTLKNINKHAIRKQTKDLIFKNTKNKINEKYFSFNNICSICLEEPKGIKILTNCSHLYCSYCIGEWLSINNYCPICKNLL